MASDALLLGRTTYEGFAEAWPSRTDDVGFAEKMNTMTKYVASSTLASADWTNSTLIRGDVADEIAALKQQSGGDILVYGSGERVRTLMQHDLVDEYRLMVFPVVLGRGKRLFEDGADLTKLKLVESKPTGAVVTLTLEPE